MRYRNAALAAVVTVLLSLIGIVPSGGAAPAAPVKIDGLVSSAVAAGASSVKVIVTTTGDPAAAADAAVASGGTTTWRYTLIDGFAATVPAAAIDALAARSDVVAVTLDRPTTTVMDISSKAIGADKAWAAGYNGTGITVAVLDTGIDETNPAFAGAIASCVSTIGGIVSPECTDTDGHGTHVSGTVASRDTTYPGIAPGASLAAVRVLHAAGTGLSSDIIAGMEWAVANKSKVSPPIRVVTMSIGYSDPGCGNDSNPEAQAANAVVDAGLVFTVAAGNSGHTSCTIDGASAASKVTTVAAVDDKGTVTQTDDSIADFSSGGGGKNNLQKPDISFPGVDITSTFIGGGTLVATMSGTSMATPHAAGTAALILDKDPSLTPPAVKQTITSTAVHNAYSGTSYNTVYGYGLGNACTALGLCSNGGGGSSTSSTTTTSTTSTTSTSTTTTVKPGRGGGPKK